MNSVDVNVVIESLSEIGPTNRVWYISPGKGILCKAECEDCGKFLVVDETFLSIFYLPEENFALAITLCSYCERPVSDVLSYEMTKHLIDKGVSTFNWETGERFE